MPGIHESDGAEVSKKKQAAGHLQLHLLLWQGGHKIAAPWP
jgi:hypothetical protein